VYCYLQINLHKYRLLLLLPFVVTHCIFYLSLNYPLDDSSFSCKEAPLHYYINPPSIEVLQVAKVRQIPKSVASSAPLAHDTVRVVHQPPPPFVVEQSYVPSRSVTAYDPPALFPTRASPV
jgi:hypothetical protein